MNTNLTELRARARTGDTQAIEAIRDLALHAIGILKIFTDYIPGHPDIPEADRAGSAAAHEVARQSLRWPAALSAIDVERKRDLARFDALKVGSMAGIRLRENPKGGHQREFRYTSPTGFALDIRDELEAIRRNPRGHFHIADISPESAAVIAATAAAVAAAVAAADDLIALSRAQSKRTWQNLAALLEPLSRESVKSWQAAGMELCREWCEDNWESFPWPDCVLSKAGKVIDANGGTRSTESSVFGKILEGLNSLI